MKLLILSLLLSSNIMAHGLYTDFGIHRIYCFAENGDIEIEIIQRDNIHHSFNTIGRDIFNLNELKKVESIPNGITFYLNNLEKSPISFILDNEDNVLIEGLSVLTDSAKSFNFHCIIE